MRKIFLFNMVTLDGFFEGPNKEIDWHNVDEGFNGFAIEQLNATDILLFGRVTYELMASYWPTPTAMKNDPVVAERMNAISKIVFSRTLEKAEWNNTRLVKEDAASEIYKNIALFGSADLASSLLRSGLIDEYRIMVNPVVLGSGSSLFKGIHGKLDLRLLKMSAFKSGNVLLYYEFTSKPA
jgi:dihydrofolate reductase